MWTDPLTRREIGLLLFSVILLSLTYGLRSPGGLLSDADEGAEWSNPAVELGLEPIPSVHNLTRRGSHALDARASRAEPIYHSELQATMDEALIQWGTDVPESKILAQSPGYNVLDNVILYKNKVYIVSDKPDSFPPLKTIVTSTGDARNEWQIISKAEAAKTLGRHAGIMRGVTWMAADAWSVHNSTLFALWRTYATLDPNIGAEGRSVLTRPTRLLFPQIRVYSDSNPPFQEYWIRRRRADTGFHPFLLKAAFPHLSTLYLEAWEDYHKMEVPYFMERVVVADRRAALDAGRSTFGPALDLPVSKYWWEPVRRMLAQYLGTYEEKSNKRIITYIQRQHATTGSRLRPEDHTALLDALSKLGRDVEVHVDSEDDEETNWTRRMSSVTRSEIVLGVHGGQLMDAVFMKPSARSALLEFFPAGFSADRQLAMQALGISYHAWQNKKAYTPPPATAPPQNTEPNDGMITIDVNAVVATIRQQLERH
ncbi:hypothetical protein BD626DRAFT_498483 [Schizophyllum amplum]|uniref:Glycosyltransferase 61 catalytic domain-containing protein n=1 Tax=Schizophyllum amplum TaxID=97359 RepID=A0A550CBM8_9AGAR|nr:hypothetical protein BD626DRAFT_498483 [Auriculariopsis ampla]